MRRFSGWVRTGGLVLLAAVMPLLGQMGWAAGSTVSASSSAGSGPVMTASDDSKGGFGG